MVRETPHASARLDSRVSTNTGTTEAAMHTLALSTLLFHSLATVTMVLGMAVNACLPMRRMQG